MSSAKVRSSTGKALRKWRSEQVDPFGRPWTQAQAAEWYGVHERTWRRWENGEVWMPIHVTKRLTTHKETP